MSDEWCRSTLRIHWSIEWCGGINKIINSFQSSNNLENIEGQFSSELMLKNVDHAALKSSSIFYCCQKFLFDIQNGTTHETVIHSIQGLTR